MFAIEEYVQGADNPTLNPNYHMTTDTIETLNLALHERITRGLLAGIVTLADE